MTRSVKKMLAHVFAVAETATSEHSGNKSVREIELARDCSRLGMTCSCDSFNLLIEVDGADEHGLHQVLIGTVAAPPTRPTHKLSQQLKGAFSVFYILLDSEACHQRCGTQRSRWTRCSDKGLRLRMPNSSGPSRTLQSSKFHAWRVRRWATTIYTTRYVLHSNCTISQSESV